VPPPPAPGRPPAAPAPPAAAPSRAAPTPARPGPGRWPAPHPGPHPCPPPWPPRASGPPPKTATPAAPVIGTSSCPAACRKISSIWVARAAPVDTNAAYGGRNRSRPIISASAIPRGVSRSPSLSVTGAAPRTACAGPAPLRRRYARPSPGTSKPGHALPAVQLTRPDDKP
jgi:hypothetical protein